MGSLCAGVPIDALIKTLKLWEHFYFLEGSGVRACVCMYVCMSMLPNVRSASYPRMRDAAMVALLAAIFPFFLPSSHICACACPLHTFFILFRISRMNFSNFHHFHLRPLSPFNHWINWFPGHPFRIARVWNVWRARPLSRTWLRPFRRAKQAPRNIGVRVPPV